MSLHVSFLFASTSSKIKIPQAEKIFSKSAMQLNLQREDLLAELARLQDAVTERDAELLNLHQELSELSERYPVGYSQVHATEVPTTPHLSVNNVM